MAYATLNPIFDVTRIKLLKERALKVSQEYDVWIKFFEKEFINRLQFIKKEYKSIFLYGEFSNKFLKLLTLTHPRSFIVIANIIPVYSKNILDLYLTVCHEEQLPFPNETFDLAISCNSFHHINNIPKALTEYKRILKPDGLFLASFVGGDTLIEAREALLNSEIKLTGGASPRVIPMIDLKTSSDLIQHAGFTLPVVDRDLIHFSYSSLLNIFKEIKCLGESNYLSERSLKIPPKTLFKLAEKFYQDYYLDHYKRLKVTLEIIHLCGWAPAQDQLRSCSKGSGRISLVDVLSL
ncbi:MAG: hypothetical protein BGO77_01465 [Caedibacter sp. 37-49]|nr:MAG: hypothetical protein BGO77_01465 [Caedibacter sp. 37-49]